MQDDRPAFDARSVRRHFAIFAVSWWVGVPLAIVSGFISGPAAPLLGLLLAPAVIVATVFWCILLYRQWSLLQGHGARTTPGRAVGFGFIPFYCFYWWFVAYAGLATDTNNYLKAAGISSAHLSFGLAVTDCILSILGATIGLFPPFGSVIMIPSLFLGFALALQQRNCVLAILQKREPQHS